MNLYGKKILSIMVVLALAFVGFLVLGIPAKNAGVPALGQVKVTGPLTKADDNFVDINDPLGIYYPGDQGEEFYVVISHDYDDETDIWDDPTGDDINWNHNPPGGDGWLIAYTKVTIKGVTDEDQKLLSGGSDPFTNFQKSVWNNEGGQGFNISDAWPAQQMYGLPDDGADPFSFDIKDSVASGTYYLMVEVKFKLRTSWWEEENRFNLTTEYTENEYIEFEIRSGLDLDGEIEAEVYDEQGGTIPLYAGASFQIIRIPCRAVGEDKTNLKGVLSVPSGITLSGGINDCTIPVLDAGDNGFFEFRIEVSSTLAPQVLSGTVLTVEYLRDDRGTDKITESNVQVILIIDFTPLMAPPGNDDFTKTAVTIKQGGTSYEFVEIPFTNAGNIKLSNLEVTLDLSNAGYLSNGQFYYDEGADGDDSELKSITYTIDSIEKGATTNINFDPCIVNQYLPPGYYKVPITYSGWYRDSGELGGTSRWIQTVQEPNTPPYQADYSGINFVITGQWDVPFIFFEVVDENGFSAEAVCGQQLTQGDQDVNLALTVNNNEFYRLNDVTYTLTDSPGLSVAEPEDASIALPAATTWGGPGVDATVRFVVDVDLETLGPQTGELTISGYHALSNEPVTINITFQYEIVPVPPTITVVDVDAGKLRPGKATEVKVTVMNTGGSEATDLTVLLAFNHALVTVDTVTGEPEQDIDSLGPGDSETVIYTVRAHKDIDEGEEYTGTVFVKYTDSQGNLVQYNVNPGTTVIVRCQENQDEPFFTLASSVFWAGLFVFLALVIMGLLIFLGIKSLAPKQEAAESKPEPAKEEKKSPPPPPKAEPADDEDKETSHDTEKPPDMEPPDDMQEF